MARRHFSNPRAHGAAADNSDGVKRRHHLISRKVWRALRQERADAFAVIIAAPGQALVIPLQSRAGHRGWLVFGGVNCLPWISPRPKVGCEAKCSASCCAVAESCSSSTTCQIIPHASACSALSLSPSSASPIARARPAIRGSSQVPPQSGTKPSLLNAITKLAERAAIHHVATERQRSARPAATPLTAQITGFAVSPDGEPAGYRRFPPTSRDPAPGR
ncbi:Uncharacterised protein [Enterobacter cancerogenus]|uniref:Uncharacterized protein n=1 Tax=Enterobacter cancerogenus TaxID=69218 RepID=A0A484Z8X5_9ENTR|nr:Uncharacterised protein [Enterobacter cancerogenus]